MKDIQLFNYCRWNKEKNVSKTLDKEDNIDLTYDNGIYFRFAIKHNNMEMLNTLLQYYEKTQLQGDFENQYTIPRAKQQLQTILQDAVNTFDVSEEMQVVLNQYIPKEESNGLEQELDDIEDFMGFNYPEIMHNQIDHNENNDQSLDLIGKDTL